MFEFSLPALILMGIAGGVLWHVFSRKVLGWVSKEEAALLAGLEKFKAEVHAKVDLVAADFNGKHELSKQQLVDVKSVQVAMVAAAPAVPVAAAPAVGTTQTTETASVTTVAKSS